MRLPRGETKKTGMAPDDRTEPEDRAAEQPSPWDTEPAEERDRASHRVYDHPEDW